MLVLGQKSWFQGKKNNKQKKKQPKKNPNKSH